MSNLSTAEVNFEEALDANKKISVELDNMCEQMDKASAALTVLQETNNQQVVKTIATGYARLGQILKSAPSLAENAEKAILTYKDEYDLKIDNQRKADAIFDA